MPSLLPAPDDPVLVAILKSPLDLVAARDEGWDRIPVGSADKWLKRRWPPRWLALYQPKAAGPEAFAVRYYAQVRDIAIVPRWQLFLDQPRDRRSDLPYYRLALAPLQVLDYPIYSRRRRRIVFISTTGQKFRSAVEINDLSDESPLEDRLWAELKHLQISAERQEFIAVNGREYALDFAVYCTKGNLAIETDGDTWHSDPARIPVDNQRDNDLETAAWRLLRFNTRQIQEQMAEYCLPTIVQ